MSYIAAQLSKNHEVLTISYYPPKILLQLFIIRAYIILTTTWFYLSTGNSLYWNDAAIPSISSHHTCQESAHKQQYLKDTSNQVYTRNQDETHAKLEYDDRFLR